MSTTNTQTTTGQFNQAGMNAYNQMTPAFSQMAMGYMNNPFQNPFFQQQQQMGNQQANLMGGSAMSNIARNWTASGMGTSNNPAMLEMMQNQSRANSGMRANLGFLNPMQNAFTAQQNFGQMASQFRPLQTGQTQTQKQSGLGTWLPQLIGAGIGIAGMGMTGGMSGLAGAAKGGGGGGSPFFPSSGWSGGGASSGDSGGYNSGGGGF